MKSEGIKDIVDWLEQRCKKIKKELDQEKSKAKSLWDEDPMYYQNKLEDRLAENVMIKISIEKYMKKLKHRG